MHNIGPMMVAVDDGYEFTKACSRDRADRIATAVSNTASRTAKVLDRPLDRDSVYSVDGVQYTVGEHVEEPMDTRFDGFPYSAANLAVAMDAIRRVVPSSAKVHVITGLPLNRFYDANGEVRQDISDRKAQAWCRPVQSPRGTYLPAITQVSVIAEAVAAWFNYVFDDQMHERTDVIDDCMAVVDIGGRTTDLAVFKHSQLDMTTSSTLDHGMLDVSADVARVLEDSCPGATFSRDFINNAIRTGIVSVGADQHDLRPVVTQARRVLVDKIYQFTESRLRKTKYMLKRILFVGGGASALAQDLRIKYPAAEFAADPQMANVQGMLKYGLVVYGTEGTQAA